MSLYTECARKKKYTTVKFAKKVAKKVFEERGVVLHCYYCPYCMCYHLTKNASTYNNTKAF